MSANVPFSCELIGQTLLFRITDYGHKVNSIMIQRIYIKAFLRIRLKRHSIFCHIFALLPVLGKKENFLPSFSFINVPGFHPWQKT